MDNKQKVASATKSVVLNADKFANYGETIMDSFYEGKRVPYTYGDGRGDAFQVNIPTDPAELNNLLRFYRSNHPVVSNCVDLYTSLPISDFVLYTGSVEYDKKYSEQASIINLSDLIKKILDDVTTLGEAIAVGNWDIKAKRWSSWNLYPPENFKIIRKGNTISHYEYTPTAQEGEEKKKPTLLSPKRVLHCTLNGQTYNGRGRSQILPALQDLFYEDQLRTLQRSIIQSHASPLIIYKLGSEQLQWIPPKSHFTQLNKLLARAARDPDRKLLYHFGLSTEVVTTKDAVMDLTPHFTFSTERIMLTFGVNRALIEGDASSYAGQSANLRLLMYRFANLKTPILEEITKKIFTPFAMANSIVDRDTHDLVIPSFQFSKQNLLNNTEMQNRLVAMIEAGRLPSKYLEVVLGLEPGYTERAFAESHKSETNDFARELVMNEVKADKDMQLLYLKGASFAELINYMDRKQEKAKQNLSSATADFNTQQEASEAEEGIEGAIPPEKSLPTTPGLLKPVQVETSDLLVPQDSLNEEVGQTNTGNTTETTNIPTEEPIPNE